jgi:hypothetical protein
MSTPELVSAPAAPGTDALARARAWSGRLVAREALPLAALALHVALVAAVLPFTVVQDTWLALVGGREVASGGLPSADSLTVLAGGAEWVDQQWLGQLALYGLDVLGGLGLALTVHAFVLVGTIAAALVAARRLGGSPRAVAAVASAGTLLAPWAWQLRTQSLVYPLFVALLWLLATDARRGSTRVLLVLPLLALWANVHGSVLVGAALAAAAGIVALTQGRGIGALLLAAPLCVLASPYAAELPGYYRTMLFEPDLRRYVVEWGWTAPSATTLPFYGLAALTVWTLARRSRRLTWFDRIALAATLAAGVSSLRSIAWFGLAALVLLPPALSSTRSPQRSSRAALAAAAGLALVAAVVGSTSVPGAAGSAREQWPAAAAAAAAHDPGARVFASERYADWLLWTRPELRGRIALDARFELLPAGTLAQVSAFYNREGRDWRAAARGYDVLVLDPRRRKLVAALAAEVGTRELFRDEHVVVLERGRN